MKETKAILFVFLCLIFIVISGFDKNTNCINFGYINGYDSTRCGCCGGWEIQVDGHTYLADSIPNSKAILGYKYPIPIYLNYKKADYCSDRKIVITCIEKRK
jgi:hypothetical protein